jgi:hypothetical protein
MYKKSTHRIIDYDKLKEIVKEKEKKQSYIIFKEPYTEEEIKHCIGDLKIPELLYNYLTKVSKTLNGYNIHCCIINKLFLLTHNTRDKQGNLILIENWTYHCLNVDDWKIYEIDSLFKKDPIPIYNSFSEYLEQIVQIPYCD